MKTGRAACARAIETAEEGKAPHAVRLWRYGWNQTDRGPLKFTERSAKSVMDRFFERGNPLVFDYEHESTIPLEKRGGTPMRGVASADRATPEIRKDERGNPELWATGIGWTAEAARQIEARERTQISPISNFDLDTKEITEIVNVALCREGATHYGTLLATAPKEKTMDEIIQKIIEACEAGDWETAETLVQQAEGMDGGAEMAKYGRACMKMGKAMSGPPPKPEKPSDNAPDSQKPAVAASRMAASRPRPEGLGAYARQVEELEGRTQAAERRAAAAEREAKVGRVEGLIATARDCFDAVDERDHLAAADPERTRKHIASIRRKREEGTLAAAKPSSGPAARPPKDGAADETFGLSATEIEEAGRSNIALKDFAAAKDRANKSGRRAGAKVN